MLNTLAFLTSTTDWLILAGIVLILFGGAKIPQLMKGLGQGMGEFRKGLEESKVPPSDPKTPQ
jgi:sec-independent protein translocase protein TatA